METLKKGIAVCLLSLIISDSVWAQEQRFAIRLGPVLVDPTSNATIRGQNTELDDAYGGELNFEWYFKPKWGLELSAVGAADVESIGDDIDGGISVNPFTVGLNFHPIRNRNVDWSVGLLLGRVRYGDFTVQGDDFATTINDDSTYGIQTSVDLSPSSWKHWAFNIGVKYLKSSAEFKGSPGEFDVDPLIWRVLLGYRW